MPWRYPMHFVAYFSDWRHPIRDLSACMFLSFLCRLLLLYFLWDHTTRLIIHLIGQNLQTSNAHAVLNKWLPTTWLLTANTEREQPSWFCRTLLKQDDRVPNDVEKREREREAAFEYNSEFVRCWDRQRHPSASVCDAPPAAFYARKPLNHVVNIVKPSGLVRFSLAGTKPTWIGSREAHWCYVLVGIEPLVTWVKVLCATPPQLRICHSVMGVSYCHEWVYTAVIESP